MEILNLREKTEGRDGYRKKRPKVRGCEGGGSVYRGAKRTARRKMREREKEADQKEE